MKSVMIGLAFFVTWGMFGAVGFVLAGGTGATIGIFTFVWLAVCWLMGEGIIDIFFEKGEK